MPEISTCSTDIVLIPLHEMPDSGPNLKVLTGKPKHE
jgi:hypothetical protein